jgi:PleD family two-component response regulator
MSQRIMAVDDSDIAQEFIRSNLAELGFDNVVSFMSPIEALEAIESGDAEADLILMDIMMPVIDGIELCARIRGIEAWRDVPIIMLTSRKDMESLSRAFVAGANDYVTKPFDRIELHARMRSCLRLGSELTRRKASEASRKAARKGIGATGTDTALTPHVLFGSKLGLQADLMAMPVEAQASVGVIALKIDNLSAASDFSEPQQNEIIQSVAKALAKVNIYAGDTFAHWEGDLFCFAGLELSECALRERAEAFIDAVTSTKITVRDSWRKTPVSVSAAVAPAGQGTIGHRLGKAIALLETNSGKAQAGLVTLVHS